MPKRQRNTERLKLPNGCECTVPYVDPLNWEHEKGSLKKPWFIRFRFYDPVRCPEGKFFNREGMNGQDITTRPARQAKTRELLDTLNAMLAHGYNPIVQKIIAPASDPEPTSAPGVASVLIITARTPLITSLQWAENRAAWGHKSRIEINSYMAFIYPAIRVLRYDALPLGGVTLQHINNILTQAYKTKTKFNARWKRETEFKWSNFQKNRAKDWLSSHFFVMVKEKVITNNPCDGFVYAPWVTKEEDAYTPEELRDIFKLVSAEDPDYAIFLMLFFESGARETEFLKLRDTDIDLERQTFRREILKGAHMRSHDAENPYGVISDTALPYWKKLLAQANPGDYIFSRGFCPGPKPIRTDNINKRWRNIILPHFPGSRPYLLKHTNLTGIAGELGDNAAIALAGWTSDQMLKKVYDKQRDKRNHAILRKRKGITELVAAAAPLPAAVACIGLPCLVVPTKTTA